VVFQTWLGVGDAQVLVHLTRGTVSSIDHGDCFGSTAANAAPAVVVTGIPGIADEVGRDAAFVTSAVQTIEALTDRDILEAVSCIPAGEPWRSPAERRLEIANWLLYRRERLQEVMQAWLTT